jgi:hypothetical protein
MCGISAVFELKSGNVNARDIHDCRAKLAAKLDRKVYNLSPASKQRMDTDSSCRQEVSKHSAIVDPMRKAYGSLPTDV